MFNKFRNWLADIIRPDVPVATAVEPTSDVSPARSVEVTRTVPVVSHTPSPVVMSTQVSNDQSRKSRAVMRANDLIDTKEFSKISGLSVGTISGYHNEKVTRGRIAKDYFPNFVKIEKNGSLCKYWKRIDAIVWSHFYWSNNLGNGRVQKYKFVNLRFLADVAGVSYQNAWNLYEKSSLVVMAERHNVRMLRSVALQIALDYFESKASR